MPQPTTPEAGEQVPARPHDSGSAANETVDGLDATTEALRHATEDRPSAENLAGYHANQKARHNHRNASRSAASGTRPVSPSVADNKHRPLSTDPWWSLVRVFPRLAKLQKKPQSIALCGSPGSKIECLRKPTQPRFAELSPHSA
jgi:hypothetical protein